jgi:hypothetical protein
VFCLSQFVSQKEGLKKKKKKKRKEKKKKANAGCGREETPLC